MIYTPKYGYDKGDPMIPHFTQIGKTTTDIQHIEHLRSFVRVQEKDPPSPQRGSNEP